MRRGAAAVAALAGALLLSACDGPAQYVTPAIFVTLHGDGTAEINWRVHTESPVSEVETVTALVQALGLPEPIRGSDRLYRVSGLDDPLHLDLAAASHAAVDLLGQGNEVFVAVCIPHGEGEIDGEGVDLLHWDSCATYDGTGEGASPTAAVTVEFSSRLHPAWWYLLTILVLAAIGPAVLVVGHRRHWETSRRRFLQVLGPIAVSFVSLRAMGAGNDIGTYWETGITIDEGFGSFFTTVGQIGLATALFVTPIVYYALGRRKWPERSGAPR